MRLLRFTHGQRFSRVADRFSNLLFRNVQSTPPICSQPASRPVVYSLLDHRHVTAYLLAIKSFWRFLGNTGCAVAVQSDGSLTEADCDLLMSHVNGIEIFNKGQCDDLLREVPTDVQQWLPSLDGMCFFLPLKLLNVIYRFPQRYVVLFDSDLLFLQAPVRALDCLNSHRVFHTPGGNGLTQAFRQIGFEFPYVNIADFNAGFAGFWNQFTTSEIASAIRRVREHDAALFSHWEIEQALWSVLLNYCPDPLNLGRVAQGYVGNGWRSYDELRARAALVHFVGSTRFRDLSYLRLARQVVRELRADAVDDRGSGVLTGNQEPMSKRIGVA